MNKEIEIIKGIILPKIEVDLNFKEENIASNYWTEFIENLLHFEKDAKPLYVNIYQLNLENPEKIISDLDKVYGDFLKEMAELHTLGYTSEIIDKLISSRNHVFAEHVAFFKNLKQAITNIERKRLKESLPTLEDKLNFTILDNEISKAIQNRERKLLKQKMSKWDRELDPVESPSYSINPAEENQKKVISISWFRYAVAACVLFLVGFWIFNTLQKDVHPNSTMELSSAEKQQKEILSEIKQIESRGLVEISKDQKNVNVLENKSLGYGKKTQKLKIVINDPQPRIASIIQAIEQYQKLLETKFAPNSFSGQNKVFKMLENKIDSLKFALSSLKNMQNTYVFDGKIVTLHTASSSKIQILFNEDEYYLKKDENLYQLVQTTQPKKLEKLKDSEKQEALSKILFDNGF